MKKTALLAIVTSALLTTSLYAYNGQGCGQKNINKGCSQKSQGYCKSNKKGHFKKSNNMMSMFRQLDLTADQKDKIIKIMQDARKNRINPHSAFSDDSFNKMKFIKLQKEKRDGKIKRKADMIEKMYKVLNTKQKKQLKSILNEKDKMMREGSGNGKNCYGGR